MIGGGFPGTHFGWTQGPVRPESARRTLTTTHLPLASRMSETPLTLPSGVWRDGATRIRLTTPDVSRMSSEYRLRIGPSSQRGFENVTQANPAGTRPPLQR